MANYDSSGSGAGIISSGVNSGTGTINSGLGVSKAVAATPVSFNSNYQPKYTNNNGSINTQAIVDSILSQLNLGDPNSYLQSAMDIANLNTMTSQAMAREQMAYQTEANAKAMDFNASEAQKTRDWEQMMSSTAHQREVADLIAAGLNPILSANQGASTPNVANAQGVTSSGAKGSVDTGAINALVNAYTQAVNVEMQKASLGMEQKKIDAQVAMNMLTNETNKYSADRAAQASMYGSQLSSSAHRYAAELDYSTWASGLHNQYAQLGEWIYKALTGIDLGNLFNFSISNNIGEVLNRQLRYQERYYQNQTKGAGGNGSGDAW